MFEFSWASFAYTIVNFVILAAILYKVLHKPLLDALAKREEGIKDVRRKAEEAAEQAHRTQQDYQRRLDGIEAERDRLLAEARQRADEAREELIARARAEAEREIANLHRDWERQRHDALAAVQQDVVDVALELARRVLAEVADQDVEARLREHLVRELQEMAKTNDKRTLHALFAAEGPVTVLSAQPLDEPERTRIAGLIQALADDAVEVSFDVDEDLVAGARVEFSSRAIDASLADVVVAVRERFAELAPEPDEEAAS